MNTRHNTTWIAGLVCGMLALGVGASIAVADWTENFDGYTSGESLDGTGDDFDGGGTLIQASSAGPVYSAGNSAKRTSEDQYGYAYRGTGGMGMGDTLFARLNGSTAGQSEPHEALIKVGVGAGSVVGGGNASINDPDLMKVDHVWIGLEHHASNPTVWLRLQAEDWTGGSHVDNGPAALQISRNAWWDVRLTKTGATTFLGEYRASAAGDTNAWIEIGTATVSPEFQPDYGGIISHDRGTVDDLILAEAPGPTPVNISTVEVANVFGLQFQTASGTMYRLEASTDPVSNNFQSTGAFLEGDGEVREMFDPTGFSTTKNYRVVIP